MKKTPRYATEAALCADFIEWVKRGDRFRRDDDVTWTPYAETAGWDILLVAGDGTQIGIQAKLKFSLKVIDQTIPDAWDHWHERGPDFRAILLPDADSGPEKVCGALGIVHFRPTYGCRLYGEAVTQFSPALDPAARYGGAGWHYWAPGKRCELPEFVPDVQAGASGPVQLTKWKIAALRIVATLEVRGHVTRQDFKAHGIDPRRWTGPGGWLVPRSERMQDAGQYIRGPGLDFDRQHPSVYAQVLAEIREKLGAAPEQVRAGVLFAEASR